MMLPIGGKFEFDDGGFYCGGWSDGKAHGHGVCSGPQGQGRYDGLWDFGFETSGTYTWPSGNLYAGDWSSGKRHGLGEELKGRWIYRGEWTHGFKGRYGVRQSTSSGACYAGTWTTGLQDGYGVEIYVDGGTYRGQWLQSMRHGFGIRQSAPYGLAVRYRHKTTASKSSMATSSDQEDNATQRRRDEKIDNERGGFVLLGRTEHSSRIPLVESISEGRLRRTLGRLKKQRSTSDISPTTAVGQSKRSPGPLRHHIRNQRACSEEMDDRNGSIHTDSCNASFISQDEIRYGASVDIEVIETYAGEWKNDKRAGFGVCERTDGLKYEGEWFNNKKNGYGITTFPDGTIEEGKYKENELVMSASADKSSTHHLFAIKQNKLREHIDSAIRQAMHATQVAYQKADIANARQSNAKLKSEHAEITANKARTDAEIARQTAAKCENTPLQLDLLQTTVSDSGKADTNGTDTKPENVSGERRQSKSMSIFAKAFGKCSDSRRPSTVAAVFHAATSTLRQTPARLSRRLSSMTVDSASQAKKLQASNNVTWKTSRERMSSESPERDVSMSNRQWTSNEARSNHVDRRAESRQPMGSDEIEDQDFSRRRNNTSSGSSIVLDDATSRHQRMPSQSRLSSDEEEEHHRMLRHRHQQLGFGQTPSSYDSRLVQDEVDLDSEERDYCSPTLSVGNRHRHRSRSRSSSRGPDGVSRRLTLPSIIKEGVGTRTDARGSSSLGDKNDMKGLHEQQNGDTYVIITDQGKRVAVSTSRSRGELSTSPEGSSNLTPGSSLQELPSRYSLVPLPAARDQGRTGRSRNRGSLPDVSASVAPASATGFISREEVQLLSQNVREERRLLREEDERRRKFELILNIGGLREWSSQRHLLIFVVAINVSLAAVFWNLLRHS